MIVLLICFGLFLWLYLMYSVTIKAPSWVLEHIQYIENEKQKQEFDFFKSSSSTLTIKNKNNEESKEYQFFNEGNK